MNKCIGSCTKTVEKSQLPICNRQLTWFIPQILLQYFFAEFDKSFRASHRSLCSASPLHAMVSLKFECISAAVASQVLHPLYAKCALSLKPPNQEAAKASHDTKINVPCNVYWIPSILKSTPPVDKSVTDLMKSLSNFPTHWLSFLRSQDFATAMSCMALRLERRWGGIFPKV